MNDKTGKRLGASTWASWRLVLYGMLIQVPLLLIALHQGWTTHDLRAELATARRNVLLVGNPYLQHLYFMQQCEGLDYSTAKCARWDYNHDGVVNPDDEIIVMGLAQNTADIWVAAMERRLDPAGAVAELARQAEGMR